MRPLSIVLFSLSVAYAAVTVAVSPANPSVRVAGGTRQFTATVSGATNKAVTWYVNAIPGGNPMVGMISATGNYVAPGFLPATNVVTISALAADQMSSDTTTVTLLNPTPAVQSVTPNQLNINLPFSVTIAGSGFVPASRVMLAGAPLMTTFVSPSRLMAAGISSAAAGSSLALTVVNPDPGGVTSGAANLTVQAAVKVTISPSATTTVRAGDTKQFSASVQNAFDRSVRWSVNGAQGGESTHGTIDGTGLYKAPASVPADPVTVTAASVVDITATASAGVTVTNPLPVIITVSPASVNYGTASVTITGSGFAPGAQVLAGAAPLTVGALSAGRITASGNVVPVAGNLIPITVVNPNPGGATSNAFIVTGGVANPKLTYNQAYRLLEQATFGPDPASIAHLQQVGTDQWFTEQLAATPSDYTDPPDTTTGYAPTQNQFFVNAVGGADQLRQRVAFALSQIFVVSGVKVPPDVALIPYLRILSKDAFGSYYALMQDITLNPAMGKYLDMVNNDKLNAKTGVAPNENYARELMQLFTLGTVMLKPDGSATASPPVATYDQNTVATLARVFTGWTYPPLPGTVTARHNAENYFAPMVAVESNHDSDPKTFLGATFNGTTQQDLDQALTLIFNHPNVAPFVALRLIQHLVKSNPSPQYIADVSAVFNDPNSRGNLFAVVKKVLTHAEARAADTAAPAASEGHLREPVLFMTHLLKSLGAAITGDNGLTTQGTNMGQQLFDSASVFNYYSPFFRTAGGALAGPEFQLMNPATAITRANFVYSAVNAGLGRNVSLDLSTFTSLAAQPALLLDALNTAVLHGQMTTDARTSILAALNAVTDPKTRVQNAIFLIGSSAQYQVEQ